MKNQKNYLILAVILAITVGLSFYALKWYSVCKDASQNEKAYITNYIAEVKANELGTYLNDKRNITIYFGVSYDINCINFEQKFKNTIAKYQLEDEIVYVNVNDFNTDTYASDLGIKYSDSLKDKQLSLVPALAIFKDGKVVDYVSNSDLTNRNAIQFLMKNNVINNWE